MKISAKAPTDRRLWLGGAVLASLLISGCAGAVAATSDDSSPAPSHTMPGGEVMSGSEHGEHGEHADDASGSGDGGHGGNPSGHAQEAGQPSEAALMVCSGDVNDAVADLLGADGAVTATPSWSAPMFTCTYDVEGGPLVLSVHDAADEAEGAEHFAALRTGLPQTHDIDGMAGLGLPAFSTGDGIVSFLRDGKTLVVDATALPDGLGDDGTRSRDQAAYSIAAAVLVCWVNHD